MDAGRSEEQRLPRSQHRVRFSFPRGGPLT